MSRIGHQFGGAGICVNCGAYLDTEHPCDVDAGAVAATDPKALRAEIELLKAELATAPGRAEMIGEMARDAIALAGERDRLRGQLAAFEGATPAEVIRLRDMETFFERVIGAVDGYRQMGAGKYARPVSCNRPLVAGGRCAKPLHHDDDAHAPGSNPPDAIPMGPR